MVCLIDLKSLNPANHAHIINECKRDAKIKTEIENVDNMTANEMCNEHIHYGDD